MTNETKPLSKYYRQPQIYIRFPSGGQFYPPQVVKPTANGEYPVMPMTAVDELAFKTPDAMMNGQATVDVIKSCIPDILDPWQIVNYDLDTILVAIRIATYGEKMDLEVTTPVTNEKYTQSLDLNTVLESLVGKPIENVAVMNDGMKITSRPLTYRQITNSQLTQFEQQKMYAQVNTSQLSDVEKTAKFQEAFKKLTQLNSSLLLGNINSIELPTGETVTDPAQIKEFVDNAPTKLIKELEDKMSVLRQQGSVKPIQIKATEEQIKAGVPSTFTVPIAFDNSNFFV